MQTHRNAGFITWWVRGIPVWEHGAGSGPSGRISHQLCSCGFHQLILLGAEMSNTMDFCPKAFSAQGYIWFRCVSCLLFKWLAEIALSVVLTSSLSNREDSQSHWSPSDPINAVTVMCRTASGLDHSKQPALTEMQYHIGVCDYKREKWLQLS